MDKGINIEAERKKRLAAERNNQGASIDTPEFRDALRVYAENHGSTGEGAARYEVIELIKEWTARRTPAAAAAAGELPPGEQ